MFTKVIAIFPSYLVYYLPHLLTALISTSRFLSIFILCLRIFFTATMVPLYLTTFTNIWECSSAELVSMEWDPDFRLTLALDRDLVSVWCEPMADALDLWILEARDPASIWSSNNVREKGSVGESIRRWVNQSVRESVSQSVSQWYVLTMLRWSLSLVFFRSSGFSFQLISFKLCSNCSLLIINILFIFYN